MRQVEWTDLRFIEKLSLFDFWSFVSILANTAQIIGCLYSIFRNRLNITTADKILGLGCMGAWIILLKYFMKLQSYKTILSSFKNGFLVVFQALVSMVPVLIGYAFLGMAIFWKSRRFSNFTMSCYTLIALQHGDMIWDTYQDMMQCDYVYA